MSEHATFESSGDVALVRLDDGKANAISPELLVAIHECLDRAEESDQAVLLAGRPGRFSAGFDLGVIRDGGPDAGRALVTAGAQLALRLARFPAPVVIACTGHALAMGAVLLMAADTRIGARGDFKIGFNEVAIGMSTPIFLLELARERISKCHFLRSVVQAEIHDPVSAAQVGFLDRTCAQEEVVRVALAEAGRLAKLPRAAYLRTRALARGAILDHIEETLESDMAAAFPSPK